MTKTAVITGAGSGIGEALARRLAKSGSRVVLVDIRNADRIADSIRIAGGDATSARVDVTSQQDVADLIADVDRDSGIDMLINNAGIAVAGEADDIKASDWDRVLDVNLRGVINGVHAAYPLMRRRGRGTILNVASVAGLAPYPLALPYTTTKHAVVGLSLALRAEARGHGVGVHVACPGAIETPIWQRSPIRGDWDKERILAKIRRGTSADSCAKTILAGIKRDRAVITVTLEARAAWALTRLSPQLGSWVASQLVRRVRQSPH